MKRTFTVNLNNTVFHIDDDAYEVLKKYLHDVEERLSLEERKEVMADIESRIAELFNERLQKGKTVVTMEDVEAVINIMGNPNQFEDGNFDESAKSSGSDKNKCKNPGGNYTVMEKMPFWVVLLPVWLPIWAGM